MEQYNIMWEKYYNRTCVTDFSAIDTDQALPTSDCGSSSRRIVIRPSRLFRFAQQKLLFFFLFQFVLLLKI